MLASLATFDQLEARRDIADPTRAQARLDDASALIRGATGNAWTVGQPVVGQVNTELVSLDADGLLVDVPDIIVTVCCDVAGRALDNPTGAAATSVGDASIRYDTAAYFTKDHRRELRRLFCAGLRTQQMTRDLGGRLQTADVVYADGRTGEPIPWSEEVT